MTATETPARIDLLIHARWILPMDDQQSVLEHHSLAIHHGRIVALLPTAEINQHFSADSEQQCEDHIVMPGLVNTHGHAAMSLLRGIADDLPLQTWLEKHIWPLEGRWVSEEFVYHGTQLAIAEMLRGGTSCYADMYFFPEASARAASEAGMRVQLASPIIDFPTPWAANAGEAISKTLALHDAWRSNPLVHTAFGPHAPYTVSDDPLRRIVPLAEELDIPIHMHVHETESEVQDSIRQYGVRPIKRLLDLGLFSPRLICVHATALDSEDIATIRDNGAHVVHCPQSNLKLASGFCQVETLRREGINVALGTDGAASNNDLDMFAELSTAAMLAKAVAGDAAALPAYNALQMATINGARAMGLDHLTGSLEPGKQADVIAINMKQISALPMYHPASHLAYSTRSDQVEHVWVNGKQLLTHGKLTTIDLTALIDTTRQWQTRLQDFA